MIKLKYRNHKNKLSMFVQSVVRLAKEIHADTCTLRKDV